MIAPSQAPERDAEAEAAAATEAAPTAAHEGVAASAAVDAPPRLEPALMLLYFLGGLRLSLPMTATRYFLADELNASPAQITAYYATTFIPWCCKLAYGLTSDAFPLCGRRRIPYIVLYNLGSCVMYLLLGMLPMALGAVTGASVALQACLCGSEVLLDAVVVQRATGIKSAGDTQARALAVRYAGGLTGTVASLLLLRFTALDYRQYFSLCAALSLTPAAAACFLRERRLRPPARLPGGYQPLVASHDGTPAAGDEESAAEAAGAANAAETAVTGAQEGAAHAHASPLWRAVLTVKTVVRAVLVERPPLWPALLFVFLCQCVPDSSNIVGIYAISSLHTAPWVSNLASCASTLASLAGTLLYRRAFCARPLWTTLVITTSIASFSSLTQLLLVLASERGGSAALLGTLLVTDDIIVQLGSAIAYMPLVALAAAWCPVGSEATVFAAVLSCMDLATTLADYLSSGLVQVLAITNSDWSTLWIAVIVCAAARFAPLVCFWKWRHTVVNVRRRA